MPPDRTAHRRPTSRPLRSNAVALLLAACACTAEPPDVDNPGGGEPQIPEFADTVLAFSDGTGGVVTCTESLGACEDGLQTDACDREEVLGMPDTVTYPLEPAGRLEIGFRCGAILEQGDQAAGDFRIWASVPEDASAVVEISLDGTEYLTLGQMTESDQLFDMAQEDVAVARFVRISDTGGGGIEIDAIEALR